MCSSSTEDDSYVYLIPFCNVCHGAVILGADVCTDQRTKFDFFNELSTKEEVRGLVIKYGRVLLLASINCVCIDT
jgi:hypothetical protein